jgi:hypothetical protein
MMPFLCLFRTTTKLALPSSTTQMGVPPNEEE